MSQMMVQNSAIPAAIAQALAAAGGMESSALSDGVGVSFANVSFKGKVFRIKYSGIETLLVDPTTKQPLQYIDIVMVDAKSELSKTYYASGYAEGTSEAPDCSSEDGVHPTAPAGKQVQNADCRTCPWNAYGSKRSNDGIATNSKACADTRKVVIVPEFNLTNENFGGPMLLRVPAASLSGLAEYDRGLRSQGAPFFAVVTRVSFDYTVAYPKLTFQTIRYITDIEAQTILSMRNDPAGKVRDILSGGAGGVPQPALPAPQPIAGTPPQMLAAPQPEPVPVQQYAPQPVQQQQQQQQQYAPQPVQQAPQYAPVPQQAPQQPTASFPQPPAPPPVQQAQQPAPPIPQTAPVQAPAPAPQTSFGPPMQQMAPPPPVPQQAPQGQTVVQGNFGGPQQPPAQFAPPPVQQAPPQQFAPPPVQQAPQAQQYAPPAPVQQQQYAQQAPVQQQPLPESVLNQVDQLLGG